jgi:recombination protein RecT
VYEKDHFEYRLGDDEKIIHVPAIDGERGKLIAVYAIVRTKDGGVYREVLNRTDVEKVRASSKAQKSGPWMEWEEEMWKKTALKRIAKRTPSSADLEKVIEHENEATGFIQRHAEIAPGTDKGIDTSRPSYLSALAESEKETSSEKEREPGSDDEEAAG